MDGREKAQRSSRAGGTLVAALRSRLIERLAAAIAARGLSRTAAARLIGVDQPTLSKALSGRLTALTLDRVAGWIDALGADVSIEPESGAEARLRASEARLRRSQEAGGIGSYEWDMATGLGVQSDAMLRMIGLEPGRSYTLKEIIASVLREDLGQVMATVEAIGKGASRRETDYRIRRTDGVVRWIRDIGQLELDDAGRPRRWVGIVQDVTERNEAEARLRASEARLVMAQRAAHAAAWEWDLVAGTIRWADPVTIRELAGSDVPQVIRQEDWFRRLHPDDVEQRRALGEDASRTGSGSATYRVFRGGEVRWLEAVGEVTERTADGRPLKLSGITVDITERKRAEEHQRLLIDELNHRVKNTLAIVQGLAQQSFRAPGVPPEARTAFEGRLAALSATHGLLTRRNWEGAPLGQIVRDTLDAIGSGRDRTVVDGPDVPLPPKTAVSLGMAVHELATNAAKYGSLSGAGGSVEVRWHVEAQRLRFVWRERGGPAVAEPERRGFGTRMIERGLASELQGEVRIDFLPDGVVCTIDAPLPRPA